MNPLYLLVQEQLEVEHILEAIGEPIVNECEVVVRFKHEDDKVIVFHKERQILIMYTALIRKDKNGREYMISRFKETL